MPGHARVAMPALCNPAAGVAGELRCIAAAVEKQDHLVLLVKFFAHGFDQVGTDSGAQSLRTDIDQADLWWFCFACTLTQLEPLIALLKRVVQGFK